LGEFVVVYQSERKRNHGVLKVPEEGFADPDEEEAARKKVGC